VTLEAGEVHVYSALVDDTMPPRPQEDWSILDAEEKARADRFLFERDRALFVRAHGLLRTTLSRYAALAPGEWRFVTNPFGKPSIDPTQLSAPVAFNLSHTRGLAACAVARSDVGIDVEALDCRVRPLEIASRFFSAPEVAWLHECGDDERRVRFVELWTLKEAYVKAIGTGLSQPLNTFGFAIDTNRQIHFEPPAGDTSAWQFELRQPTVRHRLAIARRTESRA
jgi:4'-phosphopantetheinyl transferase